MQVIVIVDTCVRYMQGLCNSRRDLSVPNEMSDLRGQSCPGGVHTARRTLWLQLDGVVQASTSAVCT